jgi:transcriptional regulator with XRE-family HTH domain
MAKLAVHWTERGTDDFLYRIASDFVLHIEKSLVREHISQAALAKQIGVSEGRVSQVLNNPGNLTLKQVIKYARAIGEKVSIVSYNDGDPDNMNGPVNAEIFTVAWERIGKPTDFFELHPEVKTADTRAIIRDKTISVYDEDHVGRATGRGRVSVTGGLNG